jgi:hypothetical protein
MKKLIMVCSFMILLMTLTGCKKITYVDDIATMTNEQKQEDFNYIITTMDELYPYWAELEADGIDKKVLQNEYKEKVNLSKDTIEFLNLISQYFKDLGNSYGHLSYLGPGAFVNFKDIYIDYKPWDKVFKNPSTKAMYGAMNPGKGIFELASKSDSVPAMGESLSKIESQLSMDIINDGTAMYIKSPSFDWHLLETEPDMIVDFIDKNKNCENLIIDIRGNGGGSDNYWYNSFVLPIITQDITYSMYYLYTDETLQNKDSKKYLKGKSLLKKDNTLEYLPPFEHLSANANQFDYYSPLTVTIEATKKESLYSGNIYVLIDGENASAAAEFAGFCKENKFAKLIGEATGGDQCYGDPALFVTPNSGFVFRFDLFYGLNSDGTCNGVSGARPDIPCKSDEALDVCLEEINRK